MGVHHSHHSNHGGQGFSLSKRGSRAEPQPILTEGVRYDLSDDDKGLEGDPAEPPLPSEPKRSATIASIRAQGASHTSHNSELARLFPPDRYDTYEMGDIDDFVGGLGMLVGAPNPDLLKTMADEHTMRYDSQSEFFTAPYWIRTTSHIEWCFVTEPETGLQKLGLERWPQEGPNAILVCTASDRTLELPDELRRTPTPLSAYRDKIKEYNEALEQNKLSPIMEEELIGGRLYSGPLSVKYQAVLQAMDSAEPARHRRYIELCSDTHVMERYLETAQHDPLAAWETARNSCTNYSTTLHVIKSLLLRLGKLMTAAKLYRGVSGLAPPPGFWKERFGVRGGVEPGFLVTSFNRQKAVEWAKHLREKDPEDPRKHGVLFEINQGFVDRGASIAWLSQYPRKDEVIFPPHTALQVTAVRDEGDIIVFECLATVNSNDMPMDMVVTQRRDGLACIATSLKFGLQRELAEEARRPAAQEYHRLVFGCGPDQPGLLKMDEPRVYNTPDSFRDALRGLSNIQSDVIRRHTKFAFHICPSPGKPPVPLATLVRNFATTEREVILARNETITKYTDAKLTTGRPKEAALGINKFLGLDERLLWVGMGRGLAAIEEEIRSCGSQDDIECLEYVLYGTAGLHPREWEHSGGKKMDQFYEGVQTDERLGKTIDYFVQHEQAREAALLIEHVVALRLYTTAAYKSINDPLRGRGNYANGPHPFPVTICYITDGIKKLRAVGASLPDANIKRDFWRGMRNVALPEGFRETGGTEYAPLSTSSNIQVALNYSDGAEARLLFKLTTSSFLERGADLQFLSAFPGEVEFLYPPLTFLDPTGCEEVIETDCGIKYTVVEVQPRI